LAEGERLDNLWLAYPDATRVCAKLAANMSRQRDWCRPIIGYLKVCLDLPVPADYLPPG
jgi:hypothetical protein